MSRSYPKIYCFTADRTEPPVVAIHLVGFDDPIEFRYIHDIDSPASHILAQRIGNDLSEQFERMKRNAYEQGYRDGRQHKAKRDFFYDDMDHNPESM